MRLLKLSLLFAIVVPVMAHDWGCWIQPNRTVYVRNTASYSTQAAQAIAEWNNDTVMRMVTVGYHTEASVFDGNYGNTGWGGLATIESYSGCSILHGHAMVNLYYSYTLNGIRGIFCQEIGHLFGLDHSNDGGCMGGGYFYSINSNYNVVSHNINDIASKYSGVPLKSGDDDGHEHSHDHASDSVAKVHAVWHSRPQNMREALDLSDAVVVARVIEVTDEPDLVVPVEGLHNNEHRVPNQLIGLEIRKTLFGSVYSDEIALFHTGNENFVLDGDPPYEIGEFYVLFLTQREDGSYRVIAPEGRFLKTPAGLEPASDMPYVQLMRNIRVHELENDLRQ